LGRLAIIFSFAISSALNTNSDFGRPMIMHQIISHSHLLHALITQDTRLINEPTRLVPDWPYCLCSQERAFRVFCVFRG
ncbi:MAG TPA: hypothetical protein VGM64_05515, partial [Lacunisphaera sp.]